MTARAEEKRRRVEADLHDSKENWGQPAGGLPLGRLASRATSVQALGKPFKPPMPSRPDANGLASNAVLGATRRVPQLGQQGMLALLTKAIPIQPKPTVAGDDFEDAPEVVLFDPSQHPDLPESSKPYVRVLVDKCLSARLRPHQVEGVQFMFHCLMGLQDPRYNGCIQSDSMGLGKSFQSVATLWTLLTTGLHGAPTCSRVLILAPSSLVTNWGRELHKWLGDRIKPLVVEDTSAPAVKKVLSAITPAGVGGLHQRPQVLIISYTSFRNHRQAIYPKGFQLLICDEAHQLKNSASQINLAVNDLPCKMRLLLSGTPLQNDLSEYFAMFSLACPGLLGTQAEFNRTYQNPVLAGRDANASDAQMEKGAARERALVEVCAKFMLRRTSTVLKSYLPPKSTSVVFCRMAPLQLSLYRGFLASEPVAAALAGRKLERSKALSTLPAITALKKLCCHPDLVRGLCAGRGGEAAPAPAPGPAALRASGGARPAAAAAVQRLSASSSSSEVITGFEGLGPLFDSAYPPFTPGRIQALHSGKVLVMEALLRAIRAVAPTDKVVLVSNYTETLDVMQRICEANGWVTLRLDGSNSIKQRQPIIDTFNSAAHPSYVLLLSSQAGGVGLNIIGANRLAMVDCAWNPSLDAQAMGRVWREGQQKHVYIYRIITAGSIEEKIYQRQLSKEGLSRVLIDDNANESRTFSRDELRALFQVNPEALCDTHDAIKCRCPGDGNPAASEENGPPKVVNADSVVDWAHMTDVRQLPDAVWAQMPAMTRDKFITFAFSDHNLEDEGAAAGEDGADAVSEDGSIDRSGCVEAESDCDEVQQGEDRWEGGSDFGNELGSGFGDE